MFESESQPYLTSLSQRAMTKLNYELNHFALFVHLEIFFFSRRNEFLLIGLFLKEINL